MAQFHRFALGASMLVLLGACSTPQMPDSITEARGALTTARTNQAVVAAAPAALDEAQRNLNQAEQAAKSGNMENADHFAFLTKRNVDLAQAQTRERVAITAREQMAQQAPQIRLQSQSRIGGAQTIAMLDLPFETGSAVLKPGASTRLDQVVETLRSRPREQVVIRGFTDNVGDEDYNLRLSQQRAEAVRAYLASRGIPADRVLAQGLGENLPIASNNTPTGRAQNRRVEVQLSQLPQ